MTRDELEAIQRYVEEDPALAEMSAELCKLRGVGTQGAAVALRQLAVFIVKMERYGALRHAVKNPTDYIRSIGQ